jgi:L-2,4-diaminobutyrate transaminase
MTVGRNASLEELDRQHLLHPFTHLKDFADAKLPIRVVTGGQGVWITDQDGRRYLDAFGGLYCVNIGYGRQEVAEAMYEQAKTLAYAHAYAGQSNEPAILLASLIVGMAPGRMSRVYYGLSGSDANETQVKLVWYYNNVLGRPQKKKIISRHRGYHGATIIAGSLTGLPVFHKAFDLPLGPILHTRTPHWFWQGERGESEQAFSSRCAVELEQMILAEGPDTVAAFIGEPMLGTGGLIPPPAGYWQAIVPVLRKYDILLIADEVICGFGRLGSNFGSTHYGFEPDLITVAKGLTSAYAPLSGVIVSDRIWETLEAGSAEFGPFAHGYTYSAHPVCAAAGLANLRIVKDENLAAKAKVSGQRLIAGLQRELAGHPLVGEVRGDGLLAAVEFVADRDARRPLDPALKVGARIAAACLARGLIARAMPHGDILGFAPPLVISAGEVDEVVNRTVAAVAEVTDQLTREKTLRIA